MARRDVSILEKMPSAPESTSEIGIPRKKCQGCEVAEQDETLEANLANGRQP
jgi:hypothetical protein